MHLFTSSAALVLVSLVLGANGAAPPQSTSYATLLASSAISRGQGNGLSSSGAPVDSYEHGTFQRALTRLYEKTGDKKYLDYIKKGIDALVGSDGSVKAYSLTEYTLDNIKIGDSMVQLAKLTGEAKYKTAATKLRSQLATHPRTPSGGFWHKNIYPNQMWGDGQYMALPFYAAYTSAYQPTNTTAWDDMALQLKLYDSHSLQKSTGLLYHGYDELKKAVWANSVTGASPEVWDRAVGWYSMALVDLLEYWPTSHPGRATVLSLYRSLVPALVAAADPTTHAWWLVMSQPGRAQNYIESSGSAMFVYSILRGLRLGYITDVNGQYKNAAVAAYKYLLNTFVVSASGGLADFKGTVSVGSLSGAGDYSYYVSQTIVTNDLKGVAAFVLASVEYESL
ncbi:glycoside hydrolase family 105 protein [Botryobasidium botryosum FD-172 SS1]|uniref:Glycoside hydrolase family 105 protein n=1 Tax=Botryobasidium botryosum (strain FD-172 SS1) TaxID=930990 RepID=A0A067M7A1_BOTB1|nr:glycoside hydrolase family 105 protein [Botryobasidium botryosum FD-172 SS1]